MAPADIHKLLRYDPETGVFTWLVDRGRLAKAGTRAGWPTGDGYLRIKIEGRNLLAHRVAWFYVHGEWPAKGIDHINGHGADNRIANLRPADQSQNNANRKQQRNNTSGIKGVFWDKNTKKWCAKIRVGGSLKNLGRFTEKEAAAAAYRVAAERLFGEFARVSRD